MEKNDLIQLNYRAIYMICNDGVIIQSGYYIFFLIKYNVNIMVVIGLYFTPFQYIFGIISCVTLCGVSFFFVWLQKIEYHNHGRTH